jgi:glycosyltransferase involved in cell wall biosynthesis
MAGAYMAADIVVSCSVEPEAFGRIAAEAAAMGRPVIATDHGGARETVLAEETGLLIPPGDATALAEALTQLLRMGPQARARLGAAGRQHVLGRFTRTRMCADTLKLYAELAQV